MTGVFGFIRDLFRKDEPPAPTDLREWNEDWQRGDLAKCIVAADGWRVEPQYQGPRPAFDVVCRVVAVHEGLSPCGQLLLVGLELEGYEPEAWQCTCFRKLRPSLEACDESFVVELRDLMDGKPVPAAA